MNLQELIAEKIKDKSITDLSNKTGIPLSTIRSSASRQSKNPSAYTIGPICKELNISLDRYFGITPEEEQITQEKVLREIRDNPLAPPETRLEAIKMLSGQGVKK